MAELIIPRLLEGMPRHASTHAAGVVISGDPITEHVPLQKMMTALQRSLPWVLLEELGLLKMDFLGAEDDGNKGYGRPGIKKQGNH